MDWRTSTPLKQDCLKKLNGNSNQPIDKLVGMQKAQLQNPMEKFLNMKTGQPQHPMEKFIALQTAQSLHPMEKFISINAGQSLHSIEEIISNMQAGQSPHSLDKYMHMQSKKEIEHSNSISAHLCKAGYTSPSKMNGSSSQDQVIGLVSATFEAVSVRKQSIQLPFVTAVTQEVLEIRPGTSKGFIFTQTTSLDTLIDLPQRENNRHQGSPYKHGCMGNYTMKPHTLNPDAKEYIPKAMRSEQQKGEKATSNHDKNVSMDLKNHNSIDDDKEAAAQGDLILSQPILKGNISLDYNLDNNLNPDKKIFINGSNLKAEMQSEALKDTSLGNQNLKELNSLSDKCNLNLKKTGNSIDQEIPVTLLEKSKSLNTSLNINLESRHQSDKMDSDVEIEEQQNLSLKSVEEKSAENCNSGSDNLINKNSVDGLPNEELSDDDTDESDEEDSDDDDDNISECSENSDSDSICFDYEDEEAANICKNSSICFENDEDSICFEECASDNKAKLRQKVGNEEQENSEDFICFESAETREDDDDESTVEDSDDDVDGCDYNCDLFEVEFSDNEWEDMPIGGLVMSNIVSQTNCNSGKSNNLKNSSHYDPCIYNGNDSCDDVDFTASAALLLSEEVKEANRKWCKDVDKDCRRSSTSQKVTFSDDVKIHSADDFCRKGPWEECARDRMRFRRRIDEVESVLGPILTLEHRVEVLRRISVQLDE